MVCFYQYQIIWLYSSECIQFVIKPSPGSTFSYINKALSELTELPMNIPNSPMNIQSVPEYLVGSLSFEMTSLLISKYIVRLKWDGLAEKNHSWFADDGEKDCNFDCNF